MSINNESSRWGVGLLVGIVIGIFIGMSFSNSQKDLKLVSSQCEIVRDDYRAELERAWRNTSYTNDQISEAQSYAWSSYDDMGYILENLEEIELPDDPGTLCR